MAARKASPAVPSVDPAMLALFAQFLASQESGVVVEAEPGQRFGFDTDSTLERKHGEAFHSTFTHRYTIEPNGGGSTLSYVGEVRTVAGSRRFERKIDGDRGRVVICSAQPSGSAMLPQWKRLGLGRKVQFVLLSLGEIGDRQE